MAKIENRLKRILKKCAVCGLEIKITVYGDGKYSGGHYFGKIQIENKKLEYWECLKCYT